MLGFFADYVAGEITVDPAKLPGLAGIARGIEPRVPPPCDCRPAY